jgi:hypothetical protein
MLSHRLAGTSEDLTDPGTAVADPQIILWHQPQAGIDRTCGPQGLIGRILTTKRFKPQSRARIPAHRHRVDEDAVSSDGMMLIGVPDLKMDIQDTWALLGAAAKGSVM